jgi:predicted RNase H-like nuclease (RuvC/YqgF family)
MDECLPLGSLDAATLAGLLEKERERRRAESQERARLAEGLRRQNERIMELERRHAGMVERVRMLEALNAGLQEQNALLRQQVAALSPSAEPRADAMAV